MKGEYIMAARNVK